MNNQQKWKVHPHYLLFPHEVFNNPVTTDFYFLKNTFIEFIWF